MPTQLVLVPYENPLLRKRLRPVPDPLAPEIQAIIEDMLYSIDMPQLGKGAAGMAANQWGIDWQIFLYCPNGNENLKHVEVIINPSYTPLNDTQTEAADYEGCFSIPCALQKVSRYTAIAVRYQNRQGRWVEKTLYDWEARVWQHENDHVMGTLCDAKGPRTIEKMIFENDAAEQAFRENLQRKQHK